MKMNLLTALKLGRVSNLPTVWSNVLAGVMLANVAIDPVLLLTVLLAISLIYISGMFFNDLFDQQFDRIHRPNRPIPAAEVDSRSVLYWAAAMMLIALLLVVLNISVSEVKTWYPLLSCLVLCALVLLYDWWHKENSWGPLIMGLCRGMVYITAAVSLYPHFSFQLGIAAGCLTLWVLGLTMVAKRKNIFAGFLMLILSLNLILLLLPSKPLDLQVYLILSTFSLVLIYSFVYLCKDGKYWNPVTLLIASISLVDAMVIFSVTGTFNIMVMMAVSLFFLTLLFQRTIEGS